MPWMLLFRNRTISLESDDGKITAKQVKETYNLHWNDANHEHAVQPGMVYISHPTENGTIYTKSELQALSKVCKECGLPLFLDGARLGYGIVAEGADLTTADIAQLCDAFYIGGTKIGAMFGEAVIITNADLKKDFRYIIKQHGGLLAKGRLLGIQFDVLFEKNLYFDISKHAVRLALMIKKAFAEKGYSFLYDSYTNQQFPILPDVVLDKLKAKYSYSYWKRIGESTSAVRFCTSWATKESEVNELIKDIQSGQ